MNDLVSLFRNFIYRDLAFILGGSIVLASAFYALQSRVVLDLPNLSVNSQIYFLFLFTVLAYVVGYTVQDFLALLHYRRDRHGPTFTGYIFDPNERCQHLYRWFTGTPWTPLTFANNTQGALQFAIRMYKPKAVSKSILRELERIRSLKVFSMCIGGCSFVSAVIFLVKWSLDKWNWHSIDWIAAILLAAFGAASIYLGWVKELQEMQFYEAVNAEINPGKS